VALQEKDPLNHAEMDFGLFPEHIVEDHGKLLQRLPYRGMGLRIERNGFYGGRQEHGSTPGPLLG
jgi:hypothetical protein